MNERVGLSRATLLETWSGYDWQDGVQIEALADFDKVTVVTENSVYEFIVISRAGDVLVRGGRFFPQSTPARLAGSSLGGSFLKVRGIYVGFNLELQVEDRSIVTSRVRSITVHN
jgi:hypothetical protein